MSAPVAEFSAEVDGATAVFTDASTGTIRARRWAFGDGSVADTTKGFGLAFGESFGEILAPANPSHTYRTGGAKTVLLTVTDATGLTDDVSHDVEVTVGSRRRGAARRMLLGLGL